MAKTKEQRDHDFWNNSWKSPASGCWYWLGDFLKIGGYGRSWDGHKKQLAHRLAWSIKNGPIPNDLIVCHRCDTPLCINPNHLFLGTPVENMRDMIQKGRATKARGERAGKSKLTVHDIVEIRAKYRGIGEIVNNKPTLAKRYGVHESTIYKIAHRISWGHVP